MTRSATKLSTLFFAAIIIFSDVGLTGAITRESLQMTPGEIYSVAQTENKDLAGGIIILSSIAMDDNEQTDVTTAKGETVIFVQNGAVESESGSASHTLQKNNLLYLDDENEASLRSREENTKVLGIRFLPVGNRLTKSSLAHGATVNIDNLQFCNPRDGLDARILMARNGQVAFVRMAANRATPRASPRETCKGETFYIITRGSGRATVNGNTKSLSTGDVIFLTAENTVSFATGEKGLDAVAIFSSAQAAYTKALVDRMNSYHDYIARGVKPKLLYDGSKEKPGLTFTEGPSWMNGRFYFSNYYMFWKEWGSSDEGGVWVMEPDGAFRVLNKNVQTCGTTPLPNGNLAVCDLIERSVSEMTPDGRIVGILADSYNDIHIGRANDVITDSRGGFYFTDNHVPKEGVVQLGTAAYYCNSAGEISVVTEWDDIDYINGCIVSPDNSTFYTNGSGEINIWMYDIAADGSLSNKQPFAAMKAPDKNLDRKKPSSVADGMTMDSEGNIYICTVLGIQIFNRDGEFEGIIHFPKSPSHCVFGGDSLSTLYVTARDHIYSIETLKTGLRLPLVK